MAGICTYHENVKLFCKNHRWFHYSYFLDYALLSILAMLVGIFSLVVSPYCRFQSVSSPSEGFPEEKDIFPTWSLFFVCFLLPVVVFGVCQVWLKSYHDLHSSIFTLLQGLCICFMFTQLAKYYGGRPRPNWEAQVKSHNLESETYQTLCKVSSLFDARMSFPSGHSSFSFMSMTLLSLYSAGKTFLFSRGKGNTLKMIIFCLPLLFAGVIAESRTRDYHHNYSDILAGSCIGSVIAFLVYFINYPPLNTVTCHLPFNRHESYLVDDDVHTRQLERLIPL